MDKFVEELDDYLWHQHHATLLFLTQTGSHLYGTATEKSDHDYMAIFRPSNESLYLQNAPQHVTFGEKLSEGAKNEAGDRDCTAYSFQYFCKLIEKADSNMVSLLYADTNPEAVLYGENWMGQLDKSKFISSNLKGMVGYTTSQMYKYSLKGTRFKVAKETMDTLKRMAHKQVLGDRPLLEQLVKDIQLEFAEDISPYLYIYDEVRQETIVSYLVVLGKKLNGRESVDRHLTVLENVVNMYGHRAKGNLELPDFKAMYHALRVSDEVIELHTAGKLVYPLDNRDTYMAIRRQEKTLDEVSEMLEQNMTKLSEFEEGVRQSALPEKLDKKYMNDAILRLYRQGT